MYLIRHSRFKERQTFAGSRCRFVPDLERFRPSATSVRLLTHRRCGTQAHYPGAVDGRSGPTHFKPTRPSQPTAVKLINAGSSCVFGDSQVTGRFGCISPSDNRQDVSEPTNEEPGQKPLSRRASSLGTDTPRPPCLQASLLSATRPPLLAPVKHQRTGADQGRVTNQEPEAASASRSRTRASAATELRG
jgi:hypothetical protein